MREVKVEINTLDPQSSSTKLIVYHRLHIQYRSRGTYTRASSASDCTREFVALETCAARARARALAHISFDRSTRGARIYTYTKLVSCCSTRGARILSWQVAAYTRFAISMYTRVQTILRTRATCMYVYNIRKQHCAIAQCSNTHAATLYKLTNELKP